MNITVDNVKPRNRLKFKSDIKAIANAMVLFHDDKATIIINKAYFITEKSMKEYSDAKTAIYKYISEFMDYQSNK
jgi:hypothetical protein